MPGPSARALMAGTGVAVLLLVGVVGGCGPSGGRVPVPVVEVRADSPRDMSLEVNVASCNMAPGVVRLDEDAERIEIEVDAHRSGPGGNDCLDTVVVALGEPIGDRWLYDVVSGRQVRPSMPRLTPPRELTGG